MTRPILRFEGNDLARRIGAVFAENVHDLVEKVDMEPGGYEAGFFHTSTVRHPNTCYYDSVWSRDAGRGLIELSRLGFQREAEAAAGYLLRNLNKGDHWGRTTSPNDSCGYEADGNALVLLGIANVWKMSGDKEKLGAEYLKAAEPVVKWLEHEMRGNPLGCLLPCISELSGNPSTPYTVTAVFPNYALKMALEGLLEMARAVHSPLEEKLASLEKELTEAMDSRLVAGAQPSNTPAGCWLNGLDGRDGRPYEFSDWDFTSWPVWHWTRQLPFVLQPDLGSMALRQDRQLAVHQKSYAHVLRYMNGNRFFRKYGFVSGSGWTGMGGRHDDTMCGYSQGYMTQAALLSDDVNTYSLLAEGIARLAYDGNVAEDLADERNPWLMHECFSYENYEEGLDHTFGVLKNGRPGLMDNPGDEGNLVQAAEILKVFRLIVGIDDGNPEGLRLMPRLPWEWDAMQAENFPFAALDGSIGRISMELRHDRAARSTSIQVSSSIPLSNLAIRLGPYPKHLRILSGGELEIEQGERCSWVWLRGLNGTDISRTISLW